MDTISTFAASALIVLMTQLHDQSDVPFTLIASELQDSEPSVPVDQEKSGSFSANFWCVIA